MYYCEEKGLRRERLDVAILIRRTAYTSLGCMAMQDLKEQCAIPKWLTLYFHQVNVGMNLMV